MMEQSEPVKRQDLLGLKILMYSFSDVIAIICFVLQKRYESLSDATINLSFFDIFKFLFILLSGYPPALFFGLYLPAVAGRGGVVSLIVFITLFVIFWLSSFYYSGLFFFCFCD